MTLAILLYGAAVGLLALTAGWALAVVLRMVGGPERWAWACALALAVAGSVISFVPGPDEAFFTAVERDPASMIGRVDLDRPVPYGGRVWLGMSGFLLGLGLVAEIRHRRRTGALRRDRMRGMDVWLSRAEGPAICGALRPRLVLPERIRELDAPDRALVLTHEAEHLRARDPQLNALAFLALVAVPWNPLVWVLRRRLARAVESDCDRRSLRRRGVGVRRYAEVLMRIASWQLEPPPTPLRLAMGRSARDLRDRLERMLQPRPSRRVGAFAGIWLLGVGAALPLFADPPRAPAGILSPRDPTTGVEERPAGAAVFRAVEVVEPPSSGSFRFEPEPGATADFEEKR